MPKEVVDVRGRAVTTEDAHRLNGTPPALTVAVVARNELVRHGIAGLLGEIPEIGLVREIADPAGLPSPSGAGLDLIILTCADADAMSDLDERTDVPVLMVADPTTVDQITSRIHQVAAGFLWQPTLSAESLWRAVRRLRSGEVPMPSELTQILLSRMVEDGIRRPRASSVNLTGREREALALVVKGLSNKQIAKRLAISSHGAKRLVTSIMLKLDAPNRTLAAVTAIRLGLVDDDSERS